VRSDPAGEPGSWIITFFVAVAVGAFVAAAVHG
jgi:hypothetical protein